MTTVKLTSHFSDRIVYECEIPEDIAQLSQRTQRGYAIKEAIKAGSNLRGSDLRGSDLRDSNLRGSNLSGSDLSGSDLSGSNLSDSDLSGSNLSGSNLSGSDLSGSNLSDSDLSGSNLSDSDLSDSNLRGSNLSGSDLRGSNLSGSNLSGSNLSGSDLRGSNLSGSDLRDSNLRGSDLSGSDLSGSNLSDSDLSGSNLSDSDLSGSDLRGSDLRDSNLSGSDLRGARNVPAALPTPAPLTDAERRQMASERATRYRQRHPEVPVIEALDAKILGAIEAGAGCLDMTAWHRCETTHCRAGWAVTVAGKAGQELEDKFGPEWAGRMIYTASTGRVPDFFATDTEALADIKACAAEQTAVA